MKIQKLLIKKIDIINQENNNEIEEIIKNEINISEQHFDINENLIKEVTYDSYGEISDIYEFYYDDKNRLAKTKLFVENELSEEADFLYDQNNNLIKKNRKFQDDVSDYTIYEYNQQNLLTKKTVFYDSEEVESTQIISYNDNMDVIKNEVYDEEQKLQYQTINNYENNKVVENIEKDIINNEYKKTILSYYENGLPKNKFVFNNKEKLLYKASYKYDENENIIELIEETQDTFSKIIQTYNEKNQLIIKQEFDKNDNCLNEINRHYNEQGNIEITEYEQLIMPQNLINSYKILNTYQYFQ